ncbi:ribonucleoside diphosphate reductase alpha subunit [Serratia phage SP1]|nr:ribonucleoside diphosphate reductase alpha subunit [Serratia phage SP1]
MNVVKSSGVSQEFTYEKILQVLLWACEGRDVDPYELLDRCRPYFRDGMKTSEIQDVITQVAANSITVEQPDYQFVASNCAQFGLRKKVYGQFEPIPFYDLIVKNTEDNRYDAEILQRYSFDEIVMLESHIRHDRDFEFAYAGTMQLIEKYLVKDRSTGKIFETPQYAYMLIGMVLHQDEPKDRLKHVIRFYDAVSQKRVSLPTPIMAGARTPIRQFSSCVVIESDDSLNSINDSAASIVKYISKRAGIGINAGRIRAEGSKIGFGEVKHTGVIPFWKHFQTAVKSCSQGGVRGGAATLYYPIWHLEVENLLVLKNNKGVEENRIRHLDYGVQINDLMWARYIRNDYITLFSPDTKVNGQSLYDAYFADSDLFQKLYEEAEKDPSIRKKRIRAKDVIHSFVVERAGTGRKYLYNVDNVGDYGPFIRDVATVRQSNLCVEIALPTTPLGRPDEEIALCTLSAYILGNFDWQDQDMIDELAMVQVRALDNLLDYQDYPVEQARKALKRRALGVGITNYAGWLADNFANYDDANDLTHELMERLQYALIKASVQLAKEKGPCEYYKDTKYGQGLLPIDWYKKTIDELAAPKYVCDWEALRSDLKTYGIRNSTLSALMPCESSSQVSNSTNGIEPPRGPLSIKESKEGSFNQLVPNIELNKDLYDYLWPMARRGMKGYLSQVCIMQKFTDQSISANTSYDPASFPNGKLSIKACVDDILFMKYYGGKTLYYHNTHDGADGNATETAECEGCSV